jgi:glycosyltransferase involved in cell wall biosynthesis
LKLDKDPKHVFLVCDYYHPYLSGLSFVAKVLAEDLAKCGVQVTVLCHQHDKTLPKFEISNGVNIHRAKPLFKLNRATISFDFFYKYMLLRRNSDFINMHLPMPEAGLLPIKKTQKLITTYQCDVPRNSFLLKVIAFLMDISSRVALSRSNWVVFSTLDYMNSSRMRGYASSKSVEIFPFVNFPKAAASLFENRDGRNFGYLGRFTSEKGALFLIQAFQKGASPDDRLLMAGSSKVAGDSVFEEVKVYAGQDSRIVLFPDISEADLQGFYASLDAFCFPSLNSFEAFGIAQVEALLAGIPVLTSDLPGVRVPVRTTGMGKVLPVGDLEEWKTAIEGFNRESYPERIAQAEEQLFSRDIAVKKYLKLLE